MTRVSGAAGSCACRRYGRSARATGCSEVVRPAAAREEWTGFEHTNTHTHGFRFVSNTRAHTRNPTEAAKLVPPPHDRLRTALWRHAELVRCVAALERGGGGGGGGSSMTRLAVSYCQPLNMLLR